MSGLVAVRRPLVESGAISRLPLFGGGLGRDRGALVAEATTNAFVNPSAETGTATMSTQANNTLSRSEQAYSGTYSFKAVQGSGGTWMFAVASSVPAVVNGTTYTTSIYLYVPANWDGGTIRLRIEGSGGNLLAGASGTLTVDANMSLRDQWQRLTCVWTCGATTVWFPTVRPASAATAGRALYSDAWQHEAKAYATSYCDGSLGTGYAWTDTPHASTSMREEGRLQLTNVGAALPGAIGSVVVWARVPWSSGSPIVSPRLFSLGESDSKSHQILINPTNITVLRRDSDSSGGAAQTHAVEAGDILVAAANYTPDQVGVSVNGSVFTYADNENLPEYSDPTLDLGSRFGVLRWSNSVILAAVLNDRPLTDDEVAEFAELSHVPTLGEIVGRSMTHVMRGFEGES